MVETKVKRYGVTIDGRRYAFNNPLTEMLYIGSVVLVDGKRYVYEKPYCKQRHKDLKPIGLIHPIN
ncbi:MAG: hypothetical protein ACRCUV_14645 [Eubacterium aggregans]